MILSAREAKKVFVTLSYETPFYFRYICFVTASGNEFAGIASYFL